MTEATRAGAPGTLPGDLMIWVLIVSELLVFGAALGGFLAVRATDASGFAAAQDHLDRTAGALNTIVLLTSGLFAALALRAREAERRGSGWGLRRLWASCSSG